MTQTNDPPTVLDIGLIPNSNEKADLNAPSDSGGKLVIGQAPNITITETNVVADAAERLALDVQEGDIAIQTNVSTSFIFIGGDNVANNWEALDFDAVGAIDGETITPANVSISGSINGADTSAAAAGEALTSDGSGSLQFVSSSGSEVVRNGSAVAYVALDESNLPAATGSGEVALLTATNVYVEDSGPPLGTPFDITDFVSFSTSINTLDQSSRGIAFNNDGTRLYEIGTGSGINDGTIYQSDLSEPYDITTASFLSSRGAADGITQGIAWNNDGSKMYEVGHGSDEGIYQYNLSTPFDISTASRINFELNVPDNDPNGIAWNDNGTRLYVAASGNDKIYEYNVSSPFSIGSANLSTSINTQSSGPVDVMWNNDGSRLYELGGGEIYQYTVATPYDITTASFSAGDSINTQDNGTLGMAWNDDGSQLYEVSLSTDKINQSAITGGGWQEL